MTVDKVTDEWESEVLATWGLQQAPFGEAFTESFFFPGEQYLRALDFMRRVLCSRAASGLIAGVQGSGKSLLVRQFIATLDSRMLVAHVQRVDLSGREFLSEVLRQFGVELEREDRTDRRLLLRRYLAHQLSSGRICLLIVENAQSMLPQVLDEVHYLASLQADGLQMLKMLLLGQPSLMRVVDSPRLSGLVPESIPRVLIGALSEDQCAAYLAHRLRAAGSSDPDQVFPPSLIPMIHRLCGGVPGTVNKLCEKALSIAAVDNERSVSQSSVLNSASQLGLRMELELPTPVSPAHTAAAELVVSMQGGLEETLTLNASRTLIGRSELADVRIASTFVSHYHALLVREPGQDVLIDLGSTNGVLVNGKRIVRHRLQHRDLIQIGPARLMYHNSHQPIDIAVDTSATVSFARPDALNSEHFVFAFGRFEDAG